MAEPVIVASADGVGTKLMVAGQAKDYSTVGADLVNHCVNDILVQGARPLFFMDYVGAGVLEPEAVVDLVRGVTAACWENGCALLGGETAEMPGFYAPGDYELVGFIVGMADRAKIFDGQRVRPGDLLVGLPSSGLHTNGYSLARKILFETLALDPGQELPGSPDRVTVAQELLKTHRSYLPSVGALLDDPGLHAMAHITGGGLTDNLPRVLPESCRAEVHLDTWKVPHIFHLLQSEGGVSRDEMLRVFNMGVGFVLIVDPDFAAPALERLKNAGQEPFLIGKVVEGEPGVIYRSESASP